MAEYEAEFGRMILQYPENEPLPSRKALICVKSQILPVSKENIWMHIYDSHNPSYIFQLAD